MNINKLTTGVGGGGSTHETSKPDSGVKAPKVDSSSTTSAEVSLSEQGKSIQQIEAEVAKMPEIDDVSVERIKAALANNEYKIDYERLAGKMIKFENLMS